MRKGCSVQWPGTNLRVPVEKNKVHSVQVCIALEVKGRGRTAGKLRDDGLHPSTTGSKRWPRTASSSSRSSPALENVSPRQLDRDRQIDHHTLLEIPRKISMFLEKKVKKITPSSHQSLSLQWPAGHFCLIKICLLYILGRCSAQLYVDMCVFS